MEMEEILSPECGFCQYKVPRHTLNTVRRVAYLDEIELCQVCYHTPAGNAAVYPDQYSDRNVLQTIAWGINYLADR